MERYRTLRAYSAGGVVFRLTPIQPAYALQQSSWSSKQTHPNELAKPEFALVGRRHVGLWALPKGTPLPGETIEQVAMREVQEETGLQVQLIAYIGSITYSFIRDHIRYHKQVRHFLLEAIGGDTTLHDHEYDLVQWFSLSEASRRLTYQNEIHILFQAQEMLQRWLHYRQQEGQL